jgi:hypothetical protein
MPEKPPQTLEELADDIVAAGLVQFPESVTIGLSIHNLDPRLLDEFADAHADVITRKGRSSITGQRYCAVQSGAREITLFETVPVKTTW